jgi:CRISPR-associated protein Csm4
MALFRVTIRLEAPLGTPLTSGTLFGQLCWLKREARGKTALEDWLVDEPSLWALSDGFPSGYLPRPLVRPAPPSEDPKLADRRKILKKREFVTRGGFLEIRRAISEDALAPNLVAIADRRARFAHNTIDRRTGSTPETSGLHFLDEDWGHSPPPEERREGLPEGVVEAGAERDVYVDAPHGAKHEAEDLFGALGETGYGRDATLGRGRWSVISVKEDRELAAGPKGRLLSLSHGSAAGLAKLRCRLVAHYGKAGPAVAVQGGVSPFKKPLLLAAPGATFSGEAGRRYGALLRNVHPDRPEIVHNAFHVAVPFAQAAA